jgi:hypothetical protein
VWWDNYGVPEEDWITQACINSDGSTTVQWFNIDLTDMVNNEECVENTDLSGTYFAVITNEYRCSITTENVDFVNAVEEVYGTIKPEIELTLESTGTLRSNCEIENVMVIDMMGRTLLNLSNINDLSVSLHLPSRVASNSYLVKAKTSCGIVVKKIVL